MPTEDAYSSGHLVLSHFGTCMCSNVETNLSWTCLVSGLLNFEHPSVLLFCLRLACFLMLRPFSSKLVLFPDVWISNISLYFYFTSQLCGFLLREKKVEICLLQNPLHPYKNPENNGTTKKSNQNVDNPTIADRLGTVRWSNGSHPTCVVKPVNGIQTFQLTAKAV